jgi:hypothetical protein
VCSNFMCPINTYIKAVREKKTQFQKIHNFLNLIFSNMNASVTPAIPLPIMTICSIYNEFIRYVFNKREAIDLKVKHLIRLCFKYSRKNRPF